MRAVLLMMLASGCGASVGPATDDEEAIQGGAVDANDPAVGLVWFSGGGFCTGTLIAPDVVLTAGHCVEDPVASFYSGEGNGAAEVGALPTGGGLSRHEVIDQAAHPSYQSSDQCPNPSFDVGLLRLAKAVKSTKPLPIATQPPSVGTVCRAVGYGEHNNGAAITVEQRRSATETISAIHKSSLEVTWKSGVVDHGDSGGPLLCDGKITATTSCGTDGAYPVHRQAYYARVDSIGPWIDEMLAAWK